MKETITVVHSYIEGKIHILQDIVNNQLRNACVSQNYIEVLDIFRKIEGVITLDAFEENLYVAVTHDIQDHQYETI